MSRAGCIIDCDAELSKPQIPKRVQVAKAFAERCAESDGLSKMSALDRISDRAKWVWEDEGMPGCRTIIALASKRGGVLLEATLGKQDYVGRDSEGSVFKCWVIGPILMFHVYDTEEGQLRKAMNRIRAVAEREYAGVLEEVREAKKGLSNE